MNTCSQQHVQPDNVDLSIRNTSRPPSTRVSATLTSDLGVQSVPPRHRWFSNSSQCSSHHHPDISPQRSYRPCTPSLERDVGKFAKAMQNSSKGSANATGKRSRWRGGMTRAPTLSHSPHPKERTVQETNPVSQPISIGLGLVPNPS